MTLIWFRQVTAPCNVAYGSGIVTVNSPSGSTLQCDTWLWDDMPLNSPMQTSAILEFYIWFWFRPHHRSRHVILHQSSKFYPYRTTLNRKNDVMSIFKMAISAILYFRGPLIGSLKSPCTTSYRSSIETIALKWLVFEKIAFLDFGVKIQDGF